MFAAQFGYLYPGDSACTGTESTLHWPTVEAAFTSTRNMHVHTVQYPRKPRLRTRSCGLGPAQVLLLRRSRELGREGGKPKTASDRRRDELAEPKEERPATRIRCFPAFLDLVGGPLFNYFFFCVTTLLSFTHPDFI